MKHPQAAPQITVEFRNGGDEETINYRDKKTGQPASFKKRSFNCETDAGVFVFQLARAEELPADYKFTTLTKGKRYVLALTSYAVEQGIQKAEGYVLAEAK